MSLEDAVIKGHDYRWWNSCILRSPEARRDGHSEDRNVPF